MNHLNVFAVKYFSYNTKNSHCLLNMMRFWHASILFLSRIKGLNCRMANWFHKWKMTFIIRHDAFDAHYVLMFMTHLTHHDSWRIFIHKTKNFFITALKWCNFFTDLFISAVGVSCPNARVKCLKKYIWHDHDVPITKLLIKEQ